MSLDNSSKQFLLELLNTNSPSGMEEEIQQKWINFTREYADKIDSDVHGNVYAIKNPDAKFKVLLAGHCDEIGFIIKRIDSDGFVYFGKVGGISHKIAPGMKVNILGNGGKNILKGVIGAPAEHQGGLDDKFTMDSLYIDLGANSDKELKDLMRVGDYAVYDRGSEFLRNDKLCGRGLDNRTGSFVAAEVMKRLEGKKLNVGVYSVSTTGEEVGLQGAYSAGSNVNPDIAIATDVTFATDYPGINTSKHGEYKLGGGPVLALGAPINKKVNALLESAAKELDIKLQYELTPSGTGTDADKLRYTGKGVAISLVSLPLRYMHSPVETISMKDLEQEIDMIVKFIENLKGDEDLRPVVV